MGSTYIFAGGFGSGKSEIALNFAINLAKSSVDVVLADLDLVNPYFASRDVRKELEKAGIRLVAPSGELSFGDVPAVPSEILGLLRQSNNMVIDVAGDEVGSLVLGYLSQNIVGRGNYDLQLVLNPYRPFAQDLESVRLLKQQLESAARLEFTGIVSNPNLLVETTLDTIIEGHRQVLEFSEVLNLPVTALMVEKQYYPQLLPLYGETLQILDLYLKPHWL